MSGEERDVGVSDGAGVRSTCAPFELFTENDSSTERNGILQRKAEEISEQFSQWRQMNQSSSDESPVNLKVMHDNVSKTTLYESLIEQTDMLDLSTLRYSYSHVSTSTLMNVESTCERGDIREDPRDSRTEHACAERSRIVNRDEITAGNKTNELTSDYSTMESTVPDTDGSTSKVTSDHSSIDQLPLRGMKQSDRPSRDAASVDHAGPRTKEARVISVNAESTHLPDHSATSFGRPSAIEDGEIWKIKTFDEQYSRNVELVQHYVERMMIKEQEGGCFGSHWSRRLMNNMSVLCRSPQRSKKCKGKNHQGCAGTRVSSPAREHASETSTEQGSPILKLRFATAERKRRDQIPERHSLGNVFHLGEKRSIDDRGVPRSNNNDFNLECHTFLHRSNIGCERRLSADSTPVVGHLLPILS